MTHNELSQQVSLGEDSTRQFKVNVHNAETLATPDKITFTNDINSCLFNKSVHRTKSKSTEESTEESTVETPQRIIELISQTPPRLGSPNRRKPKP